MKQIVIVAACILLYGTSFAQKKTHHAAPKASTSSYFGKAESLKNGVWGTIRDAQGEPMPDVEVMVYKIDTIISSGFSNAEGHYTTNACAAGKFIARIVYPNTNKYVIVSGVEIKKGKVTIDLKANPPMADSSVTFADLQPKKAQDKNHTGRR